MHLVGSRIMIENVGDRIRHPQMEGSFRFIPLAMDAGPIHWVPRKSPCCFPDQLRRD